MVGTHTPGTMNKPNKVTNERMNEISEWLTSDVLASFPASGTPWLALALPLWRAEFNSGGCVCFLASL